MRAITSLLLFLFSIGFTIFVLLPYERCQRVENITTPVHWFGSVIDAVISPWVGEEARYNTAVGFVNTRIAASDFVRKQLYLGKDEIRFTCSWDSVEIPPFEETNAGLLALERDKNKQIEDLKVDREEESCMFGVFCNTKQSVVAAEDEPEFTGENTNEQ